MSEWGTAFEREAKDAVLRILGLADDTDDPEELRRAWQRAIEPGVRAGAIIALVSMREAVVIMRNLCLENRDQEVKKLTKKDSNADRALAEGEAAKWNGKLRTWEQVLALIDGRLEDLKNWKPT